MVSAGMIRRLRERPEWKLFAVFPKADPVLAVIWWSLLILNGALPVVFAVAIGLVVAAVGSGGPLIGPLLVIGIVFVGMQVIPPIQQAVSMNLGSRVSSWLNEELTRACVEPAGIAHLEDPTLTEDLTVAREFDRGQTGPPMFLNVDFIAGGLLGMISGLAAAVVLAGFAWWAPIVLVGCWGSTHWLLRESGVWRDRNTPEVRQAQRHADYAYRLAVEPRPAKEMRLFGLAGWTVDRFIARRRRLFELQYRATRMREKPVLLALLVVAAGNAAVFTTLGLGALSGDLSLGRTVTYAQVAIGVSLIAFGGLNWALDGAAAPVAAVLRLAPVMAGVGALAGGRSGAAPDRQTVAGIESGQVIRSRVIGSAPPSGPVITGAPEIRLQELRFHYPGSDREIFSGLDLLIPAGSSTAIVGVNGAGKTTLAKLLCRLYDPVAGSIEVDGVDLRTLDPDSWRSRVAAVFQDYLRLELSLRDNVAPGLRVTGASVDPGAGTGAVDDDVRAALRDAGADEIAALETVLARGYPGGTDLSGGQWQRVALARALFAVRRGAGLVLLDEPTAQLDVRGESMIFERVLAATRGVTTVLISHRFSTVRQVDRICVLEHGRVMEVGSHAELMERGGRYRTMFDLQAKRFGATMDEEGEVFDVLR